MGEDVFLCVSVHFQCVCVISLCGNTEGEEWGLTLMKLDGGRSTSNKQSAFFTLSPESTLCCNRIVILVM